MSCPDCGSVRDESTSGGVIRRYLSTDGPGGPCVGCKGWVAYREPPAGRETPLVWSDHHAAGLAKARAALEAAAEIPS